MIAHEHLTGASHPVAGRDALRQRSQHVTRGASRSSAGATGEENPVKLPFSRRGGPLLVLAGVCGGAGTTTLAYLIAAAAARSSREPVLLADLGGPGAAISAYAKAESSQSLPLLADHLANGRQPPGRVLATAGGGLRVLAGRPDLNPPVPQAAAREVLAQARAAHGLTVIDAGTLVRPVERVALSLATHVAWVLPASPIGVRRGAMALETFHGACRARELIVARNDHNAPRTIISELADLADIRRAPLVLVPDLPDLIESDVTDVIELAGTSLHAIAAALRR